MQMYALIAFLIIVGACDGKPNPSLDANRQFLPKIRSSLNHITELSKAIKSQKANLAMDRSDAPTLEYLEAEVRSLEAEETMLKTRNKLMSILRPHDEKTPTVFMHENKK